MTKFIFILILFGTHGNMEKIATYSTAESCEQARIVLEEQTSFRKDAYCFKIPVEGGETD